MRVEVRGKIYESVSQAAKALRVKPATVYCAVSRRTTDALGLGPGNRTERRGGVPKQPVEIGGIRFESMADASRKLGFNRRYVRQVLARGGKQAKENLIRAAMGYRARLDDMERKGKA